MATYITQAVKTYDAFMESADPRIGGYFMMSSPTPAIILTFLYIYLVCKGIPSFMENRKPYDLRNVMLVYNFMMVLLSGYIFLEFGLAGWLSGYSYGCQPVDYSNDPRSLRMVRVCWLFFFSKFIEFFDTIIFCLRKKDSQVTFLHVFHHGVMPLSWWVGVKFVPGGFGTFHGWLNSWIHFVMYMYYGLAALGPQYQKYLWWKKYMTSMQLLQFFVVMIHSAQLFFIECNYPILFAYWIGLYAVIFFILFAKFYVQAYKKPKQKVQEKSYQNGVSSSMSNGVKKD